jgi:hypothetical protein
VSGFTLLIVGFDTLPGEMSASYAVQANQRKPLVYY